MGEARSTKARGAALLAFWQGYSEPFRLVGGAPLCPHGGAQGETVQNLHQHESGTEGGGEGEGMKHETRGGVCAVPDWPSGRASQSCLLQLTAPAVWPSAIPSSTAISSTSLAPTGPAWPAGAPASMALSAPSSTEPIGRESFGERAPGTPGHFLSRFPPATALQADGVEARPSTRVPSRPAFAASPDSLSPAWGGNK